MLYYIMVEKNETIGALQNKIDILLSGYCPYEFSPHLSLVYGNAQIEDENGDSIIAGEKIRFSSIALVRTPDEVAKWEIIKHSTLVTNTVCKIHIYLLLTSKKNSTER